MAKKISQEDAFSFRNKPSKAPKRKTAAYCAYVYADQIRPLKIMALDNGKSVSAIIREIIDEYLRRQNG